MVQKNDVMAQGITFDSGGGPWRRYSGGGGGENGGVGSNSAASPTSSHCQSIIALPRGMIQNVFDAV